MKNPEISPLSPKIEMSNDTRFIDDAIELNNKVFGETGLSLHNNKSEWQKRISEGGYFVVTNEEGSVKGFTVCDVTNEGDFKVWLVGVDPEVRGKGLWSKMYQNVVSHAKERGYKHILLNTFPDKFPEMYLFLQKIGAEIYKSEQVNGLDKVHARIKI